MDMTDSAEEISSVSTTDMKCDMESDTGSSHSDSSNIVTSLTSVQSVTTVQSTDNLLSSTKKHNLRHKLCTIALVVCVALFLVGVMQIPIVLHFAVPQIEVSGSTLWENVNFQSCSVW